MIAVTLTMNPDLIILFVTIAVGCGGAPWAAFGVNQLDVGAGVNCLSSLNFLFFYKNFF
jgi:hypothetical protein